VGVYFGSTGGAYSRGRRRRRSKQDEDEAGKSAGVHHILERSSMVADRIFFFATSDRPPMRLVTSSSVYRL